MMLARIGATELKLGDMISQHIKKHGASNFSNNSNFVVTNRSAAAKSNQLENLHHARRQQIG